MMKYLKNLRLFGELVNIGVENGKIAEIISADSFVDGEDFGGAKIYPGLIDIHSHGAVGIDTMDAELETLAKYYLDRGVTTWYPTTMTMSREDVNKVTSQKLPANGANIPGFHLEGPFLNPAKCGAQDPAHITAPSTEWLEGMDNVKLITVAPESEGGIDFISRVNAVVCIGHTTADYDTACAAFSAGAKCLTHTFNAMPSIAHRAPGPIVAGADMGAYAQIICDGIHIHPAVIRMAVRMFGKDKIILISDSMCATGLSDGEYCLGGLPTFVNGGVATLKDGTLAGSTVNLFECVKRAISFGIPEEDAVKMASENPARLMGLNKGKIAVGMDADFIIVNDEFELLRSVARGEF